MEIPEITLKNNDFTHLSPKYFTKCFTDVTLATADGKQVKTNKAILACSSSFFKKILLSNTHQEQLILIMDTTYEELKLLISFIYLGKCLVPHDKLANLLAIGKDLGLSMTQDKGDIDGVKDGPGFRSNPDELKSDLHKGDTQINDNIDLEEEVMQSKYDNEIQIDLSTDENLDTAVTLDSMIGKNINKHNKTNDKIKYEDEKMGNITIDYKYRGADILLTKNSENKYICDQCEYQCVQPRTLKRHKNQIHLGIKEEFPCDECETKATTIHHLKQHKEIAHEFIKYHCEQCVFKTSTKSNLKRHQRSIHEGVKIECEQCNVKLAGKHLLKRHIESVHGGVKFDCDECDFKSKSLHYLRMHKQGIHEGVEYECEICQYNTKFKAVLKQHKQSLHDVVTYDCDQCDLQFTTQDYHTRHREEVHNSIKYSCVQCEYQATQLSSLKTHCLRVHENILDTDSTKESSKK